MSEQTQPIVVSPADYRLRQIAEAKADAAEMTMDVAPAGGRYVVNGETVDANGQPVKDKADARKGQGQP